MFKHVNYILNLHFVDNAQNANPAGVFLFAVKVFRFTKNNPIP